MPLPPDTTAAPCRFTDTELDMLGKTADALTAYLGQPILAEVDAAENGHEWVAFAVALPPHGTLADDDVRIQMGGPGARWVGSQGGLSPAADERYDCRYLWGVQLGAEAGRRYTKLDQEGEECGGSDRLADLLPFALTEEELPADDLDDEVDEDDNEAADDSLLEPPRGAVDRSQRH